MSGKDMMTTTDRTTETRTHRRQRQHTGPKPKDLAGTDVPEEFADQVEAGRGDLQYAQVPAWLLFAASPQALTCYMLLKLCVRPGSTQAAPTREHLARAVGLKKADGVDRYRTELKNLGAIDMKTKRHGMKQRTIYTVHWNPPEGFKGPLTKREWMSQEFPDE
jgi:hypothetical protein